MGLAQGGVVVAIHGNSPVTILELLPRDSAAGGTLASLAAAGEDIAEKIPDRAADVANPLQPSGICIPDRVVCGIGVAVEADAGACGVGGVGGDEAGQDRVARVDTKPRTVIRVVASVAVAFLGSRSVRLLPNPSSRDVSGALVEIGTKVGKQRILGLDHKAHEI